jgi:phage gp29-like protein
MAETPTKADETAQNAKPVFDEIAISVAGVDITQPFMGALREIQDTVLMRLGTNFGVYQELRRDDQVHACFQQRCLALTSRPVLVRPGGEDPMSVAAADHLRTNLEQIPFDRTSRMKLWGAFYGYDVAECMWVLRDGKVWLDRAKVRVPWRFRHGVDGTLRMLTRSNRVQGEVLPDRKFWTTSWGADNDDDPYGLGLAHQLYWPVFFKKQGLSFWLRALEKYGAPSTYTKYPAGADTDTKKAALAVAQKMRLDGAAAIPENMTVALLEAARGTVDQATFLRQMNAAIAKIILGQTMTTDDGASLSQSQVHMEVREELTDADAELQCESFQTGPAAWLTAWNFPGARVPLISRPSPEDEAAAAELLEKKGKAVKALRDAGLEPENDEIIARIVGPGWRLAPKAMTPASGSPAFAEADTRDAVDQFADEMDWEEVVRPLRDQVIAFVEGKPDLQAAADQLGAMLADPAGSQLVEQLGRALLEARLGGRVGGALSAAIAQADADRA